MKLRNKKTGEIIDLDIANIKAQFGAISVIPLPIELGGDGYVYNSLAGLNEEWEDYKEPKGYFYIRDGGNIDYYRKEGRIMERHKAIGNYFETKEEAEKAVEKLRALKRLKDKGIEFCGRRRNQTGTYDFLARWADRIPRSYEIKKDLDTLFGEEK